MNYLNKSKSHLTLFGQKISKINSKMKSSLNYFSQKAKTHVCIDANACQPYAPFSRFQQPSDWKSRKNENEIFQPRILNVIYRLNAMYIVLSGLPDFFSVQRTNTGKMLTK
jgi:hypothetical protein